MITKNQFKKIYDLHKEVENMITSCEPYISYDSPIFDKPGLLFDACMEVLFDVDALDIFYDNWKTTSFDELWDEIKNDRL